MRLRVWAADRQPRAVYVQQVRRAETHLPYAGREGAETLDDGSEEAAEPAQHSHSSSKVHDGNQAPWAIRSDIARTA